MRPRVKKTVVGDYVSPAAKKRKGFLKILKKESKKSWFDGRITKEPMTPRGSAITYDCMVNFKMLKRFLKTHVNQRWDVVYSLLSERFSTDNEQYFLKSYLRNIVTMASERRDGRIEQSDGNNIGGPFGCCWGFYVNQFGFLNETPQKISQPPSVNSSDFKKISNLLYLKKVNGKWWRFDYVRHKYMVLADDKKRDLIGNLEKSFTDPLLGYVYCVQQILDFFGEQVKLSDKKQLSNDEFLELTEKKIVNKKVFCFHRKNRR